MQEHRWVESPMGKAGSYEIEFKGPDSTGWIRYKNGQLADGRHPEWHQETGAERYRHPDGRLEYVD